MRWAGLLRSPRGAGRVQRMLLPDEPKINTADPEFAM